MSLYPGVPNGSPLTAAWKPADIVQFQAKCAIHAAARLPVTRRTPARNTPAAITFAIADGVTPGLPRCSNPKTTDVMAVAAGQPQVPRSTANG